MEPNSEASRAHFLEEARQIVARVLADTVANVYLFGSFAWGKQHRGSDLDIAIEAPAPLPVTLMSDLQEAFEESHIPYRVDLVDLADTEPAFRERVRQTGRVWIARTND